MANNGKLKITDYADFDQLYDWEKERIRKAIAKRLRRKQRETRKVKEVSDAQQQ